MQLVTLSWLPFWLLEYPAHTQSILENGTNKKHENTFFTSLVIQLWKIKIKYGYISLSYHFFIISFQSGGLLSISTMNLFGIKSSYYVLISYCVWWHCRGILVWYHPYRFSNALLTNCKVGDEKGVLSLDKSTPWWYLKEMWILQTSNLTNREPSIFELSKFEYLNFTMH